MRLDVALARYRVALLAWHLADLFAFGIPMTAVAAMITGADHVLSPFYAAAPRVLALSPLDDQCLGGLIMWVPAGLIPLVALSIVFSRWAAAEADQEASPVGEPLLR